MTGDAEAHLRDMIGQLFVQVALYKAEVETLRARVQALELERAPNGSPA
jgi:hypothetical protein